MKIESEKTEVEEKEKEGVAKKRCKGKRECYEVYRKGQREKERER